MKNNGSLLLLAALVLSVLACTNSSGPTITEAPTVPTAAGPGPVLIAKADTAFALKAAMGGMTEVELGKMAANKGTDTKVKNFAIRMITDHGKANDELETIARAQNIALPTELDPQHMALKDSLDRFTGKAFDVAYVNTMLEDHKEALDLMKGEAATGSNADLKAFAAKVEPVIQAHLTAIQQIHDSMN